jgi:hypothetical protein
MVDDENILELGRRLARIETALPGLATKSDLRELEARLGRVISDSHAAPIKWMIGQTFVILGVVAALHFVK